MCAAWPAGANAAEPGVVPDITWGISSKAQDKTAVAMQELGGGWARLSLSWSDWVSPSEGNYNNSALSHFDRGVDLARAAGYKILVMVEQSPDWARTSTNKNAPPDDNADLAAYMAFLANRYVGRVEAYEVWNEPNLLWAWPSGPSPTEYANMLRDVAPAIRGADPNAEIVFGGLNKNDYVFVERAYNAIPNLGDYFDVMALHPYPHNGRAPETTWLDSKGRIDKGAFSGYREVRASMLARGDVKPIWLTEFGWSTTSLYGGVSPETQASFLTRAYRCLEQDPYVEVATWYNLRNEYWEFDADKWVTQLGLLTTDFTRKPAFYALKNYVPGQGGCTYNDPSPAPAPEPEPEPEPTPSEPTGTAATDDEELPVDEPVVDEPPVSSSSVRRSALLAVNRARIRGGRLAVRGRLARGARGKVRGFAQYGDGKQRFETRISRTGRIRVRKSLPGAKRASTARVTLVYGGRRGFRSQRVTLKAARHGAQLRVRKTLADANGSASRATVRGTIARQARGAVLLKLSFRAADGETRQISRWAKIRGGEFGRSFWLPNGASDALVHVDYDGDRHHAIGGATSTLSLTSR